MLTVGLMVFGVLSYLSSGAMARTLMWVGFSLSALFLAAGAVLFALSFPRKR